MVGRWRIIIFPSSHSDYAGEDSDNDSDSGMDGWHYNLHYHTNIDREYSISETVGPDSQPAREEVDKRADRVRATLNFLKAIF